MDNAGYEKDPPGQSDRNAPPPYRDGSTPITEPWTNGTGYAMPGNSGFLSMNPRYQGYSPLYNEDNKMPISVAVTQTTLAVPVIPASEPPYLGYSIFNIMCCFLPLGIVALIYSLKTQDCNARGDALSARQSSRTALTMNRVATGLGLFICILLVLFIVFLVMVQQNKYILRDHDMAWEYGK